MTMENEPSIIAQAEAVGSAYEAKWRHAMSQLEAHDFRLKQSPLTLSGPYITEVDRGTIMRISIKSDVTGAQVMELIEGIEMPVEFTTGE